MTSSLPELIHQDSIVLEAEAPDWQSAIRLAGGLLEKSGIASAEYTQAMIDNVVENGPYIVIAPGFAFAHARPSEAVHHTGMSWVRLKEPVDFGSGENDPVSLIVALAAVDSKDHTNALAELSGVLGDDDTRAALDAAPSPAAISAILSGEGAPTTVADTKNRSSGGNEQHLILTVCGNGLGTSLFLKNTLEGVLDTWGWGRHLNVEATDTISARGRASEAKAILTSGEIAKSLGDVGIPIKVIENFTSKDELDRALRELYNV
ncbi:PTS sugar transporter [Nesterenkonia sp. AN1]|uniref:Ascorbate-specific PTS system EIIA component n=1 Tax=Nesterenkonia aurantiaca TaxID=1436010 RepID=A0A4R7G847_9MICC|nr:MULTISPECIES: PTS sugar transporter subunit IIA [Nesterenkonia]EXF25522.1 PTS sugar transporter [Nesterenkonia sp. AN1]TDS87615.1 PTS system IIA component (L-Asc family) /PTS system IIB component (L-Asc family) [Nesterenkonia aurantiaca]